MSSSDYVKRVDRLVVDANIALGVILGRPSGGTRQLVWALTAAGIALLAPQELIAEVEKHFARALTRSLEQRGVVDAAFARAQREAVDTWQELQDLLTILPTHEYDFLAAHARRRVPADPEDWPYIALALCLDCGILTKNIAHFGGSGIPVWSTEVVRLLLEEE